MDNHVVKSCPKNHGAEVAAAVASQPEDHFDAPLRLQPEEVLEAKFIDPHQALAEAKAGALYCPDSLAALRRYLVSF